MSALLRFLAAIVAVSFVAACGEALPTGVDQTDAPNPMVVGDEQSSDSDDDGDDDDDDDDGDDGVTIQGGWLGSGG